MSQYEVELRGLLKPQDKIKLEKYLQKNGKLAKSYNRTQWCFKNGWKDNLDLRVRETNGDYQIHLKIGLPGKTNRKEIALPFRSEHLDCSMSLLKHLGHNEGVIAIRNANIYNYKKIEWAIIDVPNHSSYFEAEKLVEYERDVKEAEQTIRDVCHELGLTIFTGKQTMNYIAKLDREANKEFKL